MLNVPQVLLEYLFCNPLGVHTGHTPLYSNYAILSMSKLLTVAKIGPYTILLPDYMHIQYLQF